MRTLIIIPVLLFSLLLGAPSYSSDFYKGISAYNNGDFITALKEFNHLAEEGHALSQYYLGRIYFNGEGVPKDTLEGIKWYKLSAEKTGNSILEYTLGEIYHLGIGVLYDDKEAVQWYKLSAEKGYHLAQFKLSTMFFSGSGVTKDLVSAHMWANIATLNNNENSRSFMKMLSDKMSVTQLEKAEELAHNCITKNYKGC